MDDLRHQSAAVVECLLSQSRAIDVKQWINLWLPSLKSTLSKFRLTAPDFLDVCVTQRILDARPSAVHDILNALSPNGPVELWIFFLRYALPKYPVDLAAINHVDAMLRPAAGHFSGNVRNHVLYILTRLPDLSGDHVAMFKDIVDSIGDLVGNAQRIVFIRTCLQLVQRISHTGKFDAELDVIAASLMEFCGEDNMTTCLTSLRILRQMIPYTSIPKDHYTSLMGDLLRRSSFELCRLEAGAILRQNADSQTLADFAAEGRSLINHEMTMDRMRGAVMCTLSPDTVDPADLITQIGAQAMAIKSNAVDAVISGSPLHGVLLVLESLVSTTTTATTTIDADLARRLAAQLLDILSIGLNFFRTTQLTIGNEVVDYREGDVGEGDAADEQDDEDSGTRGRTISAVWRSLKSAAQTLVTLLLQLTQSSVTDELIALLRQTKSVFMQILLDVRHWGVACWTQDALTRLAQELSQHATRKLSLLPSQWLDDAIALTGQVAQERHDQRYSGLARGVLAVIHGPTTGALMQPLRNVLDALAKLATDGSNTGADAMVAVNAINMVRWIVEDKRLGAYVPVEEAFLLAMNGFTNTSDYVRNACIQLYTALILRVFKGNRAQGQAQGMGISADEFLDSNPSLKRELLESLQQISSNNTLASDLSPSLYPVLLLLTRLTTATTKTLAPFTAPLLAILKTFRIADVRRLTAKAILIVTPTDEWLSLLLEWWSSVQGNSHVSSNEAHSLLLTTQLVLSRDSDIRTGRSALDLTRLVEVVRDGGKWLKEGKCHLLRYEYLRTVELLPFDTGVASQWICEFTTIDRVCDIYLALESLVRLTTNDTITRNRHLLQLEDACI